MLLPRFVFLLAAATITPAVAAAAPASSASAHAAPRADTGLAVAARQLRGVSAKPKPKPGNDLLCAKPADCSKAWARRAGDAKTQNAFSVATDSKGNVIVTGVVAGAVDFGGGPTGGLGDNAFVAKYDSKGALMWAKRFDSAGSFGVAVAVDPSDAVLLTGGYSVDIDLGGGPIVNPTPMESLQLTFVARFDAAGNHLWSRGSDGGKAHFPQRIAADAAGNVIVAGYFETSLDLGAGRFEAAGGLFDEDVFVAKYDPSGALLWAERFGGGDIDRGLGLATSGGDVLLSGVFLSDAIDFGGGALAQAGGGDIFVTRLDAAGDHLWSRRFGDGASQDAPGLAVDPAGDVVIGASVDGVVDFGGGPLVSAGSNDVAVVKLDPEGNHVWSARFGGASRQDVADLAVDPAGDIVVTGFTMETIDFGGGPIAYAGDNDIFVALLDADGAFLRADGYGDAALQTSTSVATDPSGGVFLTGYFDGALDFGGGKLQSAGGLDLFLAKIGR